MAFLTPEKMEVKPMFRKKGKLIFSFLLAALFMIAAVSVSGREGGAAGTAWSLLPAVIAIALALITKEVYISLFAGILAGALLYAGFDPELTLTTLLYNEDGGFVPMLASKWNAGILVFLVVLGILAALMNRSGGAAAFGRWVEKRIRSGRGAQLATAALGMLIFIDDYFNCLTVGGVMRTVTDRNRISRAKLAWLIDATAAPVCIIAPISSWAAAVTSSVPEDFTGNGFSVFLQTIPYNFYAILTIFMVLFVGFTGRDFGPMAVRERNAAEGDLFTVASRPYEEEEVPDHGRGHVLDMIIPMIVLIVSCITGLVYTGGSFDGVDFITAFADADAAMGLVLGSMTAIAFAFIYFLCRRTICMADIGECIISGFKAMVPAILILAMAWTLSGMTGLLGGAEYVGALVDGAAEGLSSLLPGVVFAVSVGLAFATGTSWGTFSIIVPIVCSVFPEGSELLIIAIAACLAGAVCGDHCSPISDTTIMASAGARCDHVDHVNTQMPYVMPVAAVCFVGYIVSGFVRSALIMLPLCLAAMAALLILLTHRSRRAG